MKRRIILAPLIAAFFTFSCEEKPKVPNEQDTTATTSAPSDSHLSRQNPPDSTAQAVEEITPQQFVDKANTGHILEIKLSELAQQKAKNKELKSYSQMIVKHHGQAKKELVELAKKQNLITSDSLMPEQQQKVTDLKGLSGAEFDKQYVQVITEEHKKDAEFYKMASQSLKDTTLIGYVNKTLPTIEGHLKTATDLNQKVLSDTASVSKK